MEGSRENSTLAVFFHSMIAEQVGLGASEEKTLFLLQREGALTAGEIALRTGLTTSSVTSLIDRLESKGFVRRVRDMQDRRRVIVEIQQEKLAELNDIFQSLQENFMNFLDSYSDEQLMTITDFLMRSAQQSQEFLAHLQQKKGV